MKSLYITHLIPKKEFRTATSNLCISDYKDTLHNAGLGDVLKLTETFVGRNEKIFCNIFIT